MLNFYSPTKFTMDEVAMSLNVSKSLLRFWEEEFGLKKRENGVLGSLEVAEMRLIHSLVNDKGLTLEDAKIEFNTQRPQITQRFKTIENLEKIKSGLLNLREKI
jgi:MerR HTH family regulatory protein